MSRLACGWLALVCHLMASVLFGSCSHGEKRNSAASIPRESETLSDEDEYRLGRQVSAKILEKNPPIHSPFSRYATVMAQYLASFSIRPLTFKGYRVQLINASGVAAFSTPGGFIFVSKHLVAAVKNEDELAGVVAHEISHVALRHGEMAIRRKTSAAAEKRKSENISKAAANVLGGVAKLGGDEETARTVDQAKIAGDSILDVSEQLLVSGYNHDQEFAADKMALGILLDAGYNPEHFADFLERNFSTSKRLGDHAKAPGSMFTTHPMDETRIKRIRKTISGWRPGPPSGKREQRFRSIQKSVLDPP